MHTQLVQDYPDLLVNLQEQGLVSAFIGERFDEITELPDLPGPSEPEYISEEICNDAFRRNLGLSKFNYVCSLLQEEYESVYYDWLESGILVYEVINLLEECNTFFSQYGFNAGNEEDEELLISVKTKIREYVGQ